MALAAHAYHAAYSSFPAGITLSTQPPGSTIPATTPPLPILLPYLEHDATYETFQTTLSITTHPANYSLRTQQVATYLCPADPSTAVYTNTYPPTGGISGGPAGRSNYFGNVGTTGYINTNQLYNTAGMFGLGSTTTLTNIPDGTSNTALFAEVKRWTSGGGPGGPLDVTVLSISVWGAPSNHNANDVTPLSKCDPPPAPVTYYTNTGLQYYSGSPNTALYTHTVPPNYTKHDCASQSGVEFHLAARSYHPGGVNVAFADGSTHFVSEAISFAVWQALGTRANGDTEPEVVLDN